MNSTLRLKSAQSQDLVWIENLLNNEHLPSSDISSQLEHIYIAYLGSEPVGIGGLELHGSYALLRSLVIRESFRNQGYGKQLIQQLTQKAAHQKIQQIYLLTIYLQAFFSKIGFESVERDQVPAEIQATIQFSSLCPSTAICMKATSPMSL